MSLRGSIWVASLSIWSGLGCSQQAPVLSSRATTLASASPTAGAAAPSGGSAGAAGAGEKTTTRSNPTTALVPVSVSAAGASAAAPGGGGDATTPCAVGTFCPPSEPDPSDCGQLNLQTDTKTVLKPGNVLVVFDRSGSMESNWNGTPKYQAAGAALTAAITPLKDVLRVGGVFFPSAGVGDANCPNGCNALDPLHWIPGPGACCLNNVSGACGVNSIDKPDQLQFGSVDAFIKRLPAQSHLKGANGTPLEAGIARAAEAVTTLSSTDPLVVVVMTDGEPNCNSNSQKVLAQISSWKLANIATYVVGLPGAQGAANLLNQMAAAGGTTSYIDPKDPQELETRLRAVVSSTVRAGFDSCSFHLAPKADVPDKLHLVVMEHGQESDVPRDLSKDVHWTINSAGDQVDLEGQLCDLAKSGAFESLRFVFGCVDVPPLEPPPPPALK